MASTARYQLLSPWPEQAMAFTSAIERVARLIGRARSGLAVHFQLTVPGWRMLHLVEQSGNRATLTHLARRLQVKRPSARVTASRLRDLGYLSIGRLPGDRRSRLLAVTEAGLECLSEVDAGIEAMLLEMTSDVPRGVRRVDEPAGKLSRCLRPASACWSSS